MDGDKGVAHLYARRQLMLYPRFKTSGQFTYFRLQSGRRPYEAGKFREPPQKLSCSPRARPLQGNATAARAARGLPAFGQFA